AHAHRGAGAPRADSISSRMSSDNADAGAPADGAAQPSAGTALSITSSSIVKTGFMIDSRVKVAGVLIFQHPNVAGGQLEIRRRRRGHAGPRRVSHRLARATGTVSARVAATATARPRSRRRAR